jgi:hypothetical protein
MAPLPPAAKTLKITLVHATGGDNNVENILHFKYTGGPPSSADCIGIAGAVNAQYATNLKSLLSTNYSLSAVRCLDIDSNTGAQGENDVPVLGTRVGAILPISNAVVISHQIARRYRGGHPRSYAPFGAETDLGNNQHWGATFITSCTTGWNTFAAGCITITAGTTVLTAYASVSYYSGKTQRGTPVVDTILNSQAKTRVGSQRRRLGKM